MTQFFIIIIVCVTIVSVLVKLYNHLLTNERQWMKTVFITPPVAGCFDNPTMMRHGHLRVSIVLPVAAVHHSVLPNPESDHTTLSQANPERACVFGPI